MFSHSGFSHKVLSLLILKKLLSFYFNLISNQAHRECCSLPQAQQSPGKSWTCSQSNTGQTIIHAHPQAIFIANWWTHSSLFLLNIRDV